MKRDPEAPPVKWFTFTLRVGPIGFFPSARDAPDEATRMARRMRDGIKGAVAVLLRHSPRTRSKTFEMTMEQVDPPDGRK